MLSSRMDHSDVRASYHEDHGFWIRERLGSQVFDAAGRHPDREFVVIRTSTRTATRFLPDRKESCGFAARN